MRRRSYELWVACLLMALIATGYVGLSRQWGAVPAASELVGHGMGIVGFLLMLMTETLYSLRKRSRSARWGRTVRWLQFHIVTGLVGPFLVLLHTSWKFNGLAGVVALMTGSVVLSGFVGRYIYTAVPRSADGVEVEAAELERQIAALEADLQRWLVGRSAETRRVIQRLETLPDVSGSGPLLILGRVLLEWDARLTWWRERRRLGVAARSQSRQLDGLLRRRRALHRQVASLALARRMLSIWRAVHIPVGVALFTAAFVHIGAAVYYATLLR